MTTPEEYSVRSSVWKISVQGDSGTGFFITANKFITNFHVIYDSSKVEDITLSQEGSARILKIKGILAISALHDLALLETTGSVDHYLSIKRKPLQEQEDVFLTGYPGGKLTDIRKTSDGIMFSKDTTSFFVNHHSSLHGASGSPIVNVKKQVVGVQHLGSLNLIYSVNLNDLQVFVQRGLRNKPRNNPRQAVKREIQNLRNLAIRGSAKAQYMLGWMYYEGGRVAQNFEKAADLFKQAAEQGMADAQVKLGGMYYHGEGVIKSYEKAVDWYTKAAEQGHVEAQLNLGLMYFLGEGVTKNFEMAVDWLKQAAKQSHPEAQYMLGMIYKEGEGVTQNYEMAVDLFKQAAEQGNAIAQNSLGVMYYEGKGVAQNYEKAVDLFKQAAEQGQAEAQLNLGEMYYEGKRVTQNFEMAAHWYEKAAMQGNAAAQARLGAMYYEGEGVSQNFEKAAHWLKQAAEQGHVEAKAMLEAMPDNM